MHANYMWQQWLNALLGVWVIAVPFLFGIASSSLLWTLVISGIVVAALALWGIAERNSEEEVERVTRLS